ncbi:packaged DNA stabilization protein [Paraburkholderia rhynchosiae]|uniref:Uncharacterized protein n=1 Tax=Paraburkholderia rhynchosiae TaxID=487049 RepID=A0A2N7W9C7_9BURK|nr:packaged DNA stabilization protein [Paraburkholderia rhynchosiae]PMS26007.1 hypothetical protein C0Z16_28140 [Paraburkholderia rhynchosiae]CAB3731121.1 hypothetical protein LMG27174_05807 [Paraburkholderia rhynchosiae]
MKTPFFGGAYQAFSKNLDAQRCVNLYLENDESKQGRDIAALRGCPGLDFLCTCGTGPIRGVRTVRNLLYVVSGFLVFSVDAALKVTTIGSIGTSTSPVSMSDNGSQVIIVDGQAGYLITISTATITQITDAAFPSNPVTVTFFDSFFIVNQGNTQQFWVSGSNDGSVWDGTDFASKEGGPDLLVGLIQVDRQLWLFGDNTTEVWYDAGGSNFPFARVDGVFVETGLASPYCMVLLDNSVFWLGADQRGQGIVYRSNGYQPQRISTFAIERVLSAEVISDAIAYSYQANGHSFYVLLLPSADMTFVFDVSTNLWHERASYDPVLGQFHRHRSNCADFFNGMNVVGDYQNGNIYVFNDDTPTDNGVTRKWVRSWQALPEGLNRGKEVFYSNLEIFAETGQAPQTGQAAKPTVSLRISNDGGHTFPIEQFRSMGLAGQTTHRLLFQNLGKSRNRVFELSGTAPIVPVFVGAELDAVQGTS